MPTSASKLLDPVAPLRLRHLLPVVLQRKSHVLLDGQRVVKRGLLKQKTHLLSDFAHLVESQAGDVLTVDANRSRVRLLQADDEPQQYALASATAPQHRQGLAAAHGQADPVQDLLTSEGLMQVLDGDDWRTAVFLGFFLLASQFDRLFPYLVRVPCLTQCSREKYEDEFHQHHIGQDHEQRRQDHRTRGRTAHARGASLCPHSLKTRDQPNDQAKHRGLKRGRQEIVEIGAVKTALMNWWNEIGSTRACATQPISRPQKSAARVSKRQHQDASQDAGRRQQPDRGSPQMPRWHRSARSLSSTPTPRQCRRPLGHLPPDR